MTAASKRHMERVAELPCVICGRHGVQVHHIRVSGLTGASLKASDWLTIALCPEEHAILHSDIKAWERRNGKQIDHVTATLEQLYG